MTRIYPIQHLRAVAALMVVAFHASLRVETVLPASLYEAFYLGHAGVDVFFVISGFIIWIVGARSDLRPWSFFHRRLLRVAPLYWLATVAWVLLAAVGLLTWVQPRLDTMAMSLAFIPHYNVSLPEKIFPILIPGWTLNFEMFFYLLFSIILFLPEKRRLPAISATIVGLVILGLVISPVDPLVVTYTSPLMLEFLAGCVLAHLWQRHHLSAVACVALVLVGMIGFAALFPFADADDAARRTITFGLPALLTVAGAAWLSRSLPRVRLLERLGDASYAIYLTHLFFVVLLDAAWQRLPGVHNAVAAVLFIILSMVGSTLLGLLVHRGVEIHISRLPSRRPASRMVPERPAETE